MHTKNYFLSFMVAFVFCWTNLAAQEQPFTYVVATDNSGDFTTVQAAVDACKEGEQRSIIFIKNGTYKEMVNVPKGKIISLIGESAEGVLITFDRDRGAGSDFTDFRDITTCQFYGEDMYVEGPKHIMSLLIVRLIKIAVSWVTKIHKGRIAGHVLTLKIVSYRGLLILFLVMVSCTTIIVRSTV
jgi:hypothetical protein